MMKSRTISAENSLFSADEVERMKVKQQENISRYAEEVMKLGNEYRYKQLQVNGALIIGSGPEGWRAYAVIATEGRVGEIRQAIEREVR